MTRPFYPFRTSFTALAMLALPACAGTYTGPVEVTRFVAENPVGLGEGQITLTFPREITNEIARNAFADAVAGELENLGYTLVMERGGDVQEAAISTSRGPVERFDRRGPVTVGGGASTGSFGSGVGLGVGINLGGGNGRPELVSELSVRITAASGETLWEGRSELPTSVNSPYSEIGASAQALAAALFRDFPGGNGETVQVSVDELERTP
ncbi:hypothetical protein [Erythrobacter ani]|uniref:DUF4136 domain-containing protein n=1 Tax=Erythrobacter ani TaxID=2827235 RepID=A0ABS6SLP3_9SPHN|nr:hypothetical protein [Erythrobacter ani]MBV7265946.1 hypothetical protein [Erythrobacter ani]